MSIDELIVRCEAWLRACTATGNSDTTTADTCRSVLALLAPDKPCIADVSDIVNVDADGYVTIHVQRDLRPDEARWAAVEILKAAEAAEGEGK